MNGRCESSAERRRLRRASHAGRRAAVLPRVGRPGRAFTLIEIMIVVAILGIVMSMGLPAIYRAQQKEGMRKAVADILEVCSNARAQAILRGTTVELRIRPQERRFEVTAAPPAPGPEGAPGEAPPVAPAPPAAALPRSGLFAQITDEVSFEMVDVNFVEYKEAEEARVRFHPNGTSDELTVVLRSDRNEFRKISLEVTTGLATWEAIGIR
jgi:prepilin-type N-terminal cleavage/methylation domain-containing protein